MRYTTSMDQEMKRRVTACAAGFSLPRYRELPAVGLYLDQTVQLVNSCFRGFPGVELTPSMVSNYVKKGVISHPVKKKYSREQLAALLYIVLSKNVLSLENIEMLFRMQRTHCTAADSAASGRVPSGAGAQSYRSTKVSMPRRAKARPTGAPSRIEQCS